MFSSCAQAVFAHNLPLGYERKILRAGIDCGAPIIIAACIDCFLGGASLMTPENPQDITGKYILAMLLHVNAVSSPCWDSFWGRTERSIIRNHSRLVQHTVGDSTAG